MATLLPLNRYKKAPQSVFSQLDPMSDLLSWLEFLTAKDYLVEVLAQQHGMPAATARNRAKQIIPHVRLAIGYLSQAQAGPHLLSFLPAYYAVLNLSKVYILTGPRYADLANQRRHGVSYEMNSLSHSVMTEEITLHPHGVMSLFYESLTGSRIRRATRVRMDEVYPFLNDIESEYEMAVGGQNNLGIVHISADAPDGNTLQARATFTGGRIPVRGNEVRVLVGARQSSEGPGVFLGSLVRRGTRPMESIPSEQVRWFLLYAPTLNRVRTPVSGRHLLMPEELPIALLFFHMGSVVRYKPEFLERLQESRYWPMLTTARRHSLLKFMLLFWSHMHQRATTFSSYPV